MKLLLSAHSEQLSPHTTVLILVLVVFMGFLTIGIPLPVLPLHVSKTLLLSSLAVGVVMGAQSFVTLITRMPAGRMADSNGSKKTVLFGLIFSALSGGFYLLSLSFSAPTWSLVILLLGRFCLGLGESMVMTGSLSWGIGLLGKEQSAQVIAWMGLAMYAAFAFGAPIGMMLYNHQGFVMMSIVTALLPCVGLLIALGLPSAPLVSRTQTQITLGEILHKIWVPGMGMALGATSFAILASFLSLFYAEQAWEGASMGLTVFGVSYIIVRLFFMGTLKKFGALPVVMVSLLIGTLGQLLLWLSSSPTIALLGASLTGVGYSLVLPSFGAEVVKQIPDDSRGVALGTYTAFFDLSLAVSSPLVGLVITQLHTPTSVAFLFGMVGCIAGFLVAYVLYRKYLTAEKPAFSKKSDH